MKILLTICFVALSLYFNAYAGPKHSEPHKEEESHEHNEKNDHKEKGHKENVTGAKAGSHDEEDDHDHGKEAGHKHKKEAEHEDHEKESGHVHGEKEEKHADHDEHGEEGHGDENPQVGKGKGITEASEEEGIKLSPEATKNFGIILEKIEDFKNIKISKKTIVTAGEEVNVFRYRDGFFKRIDFELLKKENDQAYISSKDFKPGDQIVVGGMGFLRIAEIAAFGGAPEGHSH